MNRYCIFLASLLTAAIALATHSHAHYFTVLKQKQRLPKGAVAIAPTPVNAALTLLARIQQDTPVTSLHPQDHSLIDLRGNQYELYQGDFSHEHKPEALLLLIHSGSIDGSHVSAVYQKTNGHWRSQPFNQILIRSLLPGKDLSAFYLHTAKPFLFIQNNQTYFRTLQFPPQGQFDPSKILVCTYQWRHSTIRLVSAGDCIGRLQPKKRGA